eukprot:29023-Chlamydomonas_euryale.AAC.13
MWRNLRGDVQADIHAEGIPKKLAFSLIYGPNLKAHLLVGNCFVRFQRLHTMTIQNLWMVGIWIEQEGAATG